MIDEFWFEPSTNQEAIKHGYYYVFENSQPTPAKFLATVIYRQRYMQG